MRFFIWALLFCTFATAQTNTYEISFDNAVHHEAAIKVTFPNLKTKTITARMSRTSPGRYAIHEFAKNVFNVQATDSKGNVLDMKRPDPYSWEITGHDGTVHVSYTLFANRADGTYSQIDESHAHLNIPATFMYVEALKERPLEVTFNVRKDLNWKVATQLKPINGTKYYAPNTYYFMDSPAEISDFSMREFMVDGQQIRFALHHDGKDADFDTYWDRVQEIVRQEKAVFGELPTFDYGTYTFLACYLPHVSGDGMEHRNSTILTSTRPLAESGLERNIGTVSHEFFHAWNVERIRPDDLEPFSFEEANMSESLWFAEGFTSYYTNLILARGGIITPEAYVKSLNGTFNYVWNSPARTYFNPIEMSYQAPFVDAATSVDPVNRENTFISYYSYGSILGLALDLSLREQGLNLDDYMKLVWETYGKNEVAYRVVDLEKTLGNYAGNAFAKAYFERYIYNSEMPDYKALFNNIGLDISQDEEKPSLGASLSFSEKGILIARNTAKNSAAYKAGLTVGDVIEDMDGEQIRTQEQLTAFLSDKEVGESLTLGVTRHSKGLFIDLILQADPTYTITMKEKVSKKVQKARDAWLGKK